MNHLNAPLTKLNRNVTHFEVLCTCQCFGNAMSLAADDKVINFQISKEPKPWATHANQFLVLDFSAIYFNIQFLEWTQIGRSLLFMIECPLLLQSIRLFDVCTVFDGTDDDFYVCDECRILRDIIHSAWPKKQKSLSWNYMTGKICIQLNIYFLHFEGIHFEMSPLASWHPFQTFFLRYSLQIVI